MKRQFIAYVDGEAAGKFTIKCSRGQNNGWTAWPHFRGYNFNGSWSLDKSAEYVDKNDAIAAAYNELLRHEARDGYVLVGLDKTQWALS
jgi:hypothetical protein